MTEQKVLSIKRKDGSKLLIVSSHIYQAESLGPGISRIHYEYDKQIDIFRDIEWVLKHLAGNYGISGADEA